MPRASLNLQISPTVAGIAWRLYPIEFATVDGKFSAYFYAVSDEHAQALLDDLKSTATVGAPLEAVVQG